jgi:outer membrane receptor protein involved in Fe transport
MSHHYKNIFITLFFSIACLYTHAQNTMDWQPTEEFQVERKVLLIGKIIDETNQTPLEYATLTLYTQQDSTMITGGVTNIEGAFEIETVPGSYFAKIEFISYETKYISDITIDGEQKILDLGIITMNANSAVLDIVEVRAEKSQMQMALDKRVFNVGKDLANRGGTADDLLDNIPSVAVDVEGNVTLRGNGNVRILVNGKPSGLIGVGDNNGLRQFPTSMIDRVEVITNPSARYEAEGVAGIINIILKKDNTQGLNGSFDVTVGYPKNYGATVNMNYRRNNFNLFGSYGLNYRLRNGGGGYFQEFYKNDTIFILDQNRSHERGGLSNSFRFGSDYYINPKNTLTAALTYKISDEQNITDIEYRDYINQYPNNFQGVTYRTDDEKEDESSLEYSLNYKKTFSNDDHVLTADVRYEDDIETERNKYLEEFYGSDNLPTGKSDLQQRALNEEKNKEWRIQIDYVHPFSKEGKFEMGIRSSIRKINNSYVVEEFDDVYWDTLKGLTNDFDYDENIHAAYASFGNKYGKFSFLAGLRGELSEVSTKLLQTDEVNDRNYFNLFPSLHLTYDLPQQNAIQLSYSRRINRPGYRSLNPFRSFSDSRNLYQGNPDLNPEFTHALEVGHIKYWDKATLSSAIYYRHTDGVVQRIKTINDDGNTVSRPENLATEDAYGLETTFSYSPLEWWKFDGDLNFYRSIVDGTNLGENFKSDNFSWFGRLTSRMSVWKATDIQLRFNYRAPTQTTQGTYKAIYFMDFAISKDIMKNNATITLSASDIFNTRKRRYTTFGDDFYTEGEFQWRTREVKLTLNYRLNQKKKKSGGGGFEGGEEGGF